MSEEVKTVEPTVSETPSEVKTEEVKTEEKPAEALDRAAKIEKYQREQKAKLEAEKLRIESERAELAEYKKLKTIKTQDPVEALKLLGITIDDVVKAASNPRTVDPVAEKALKEVEAIKAELQAEKDKIRREQLAKIEQEINHNIDLAIKEGEYDLISELGLVSSVRSYMEEHYEKTGEILDPKDAAKQVNDLVATSIKKVLKSKWLTAEEKKEIVAELKEEAASLSQDMTTEAPRTKKPMTEKERIEAAMQFIK